MKWRLLSIKRAVSVDRMPQSRRSILSKYFPSLKETAIIDDLIVNENLKLTTIKYNLLLGFCANQTKKNYFIGNDILVYT